MSDVFISYSSDDREKARAIAAELERRGLTVWWDRVIPPGRQYDEIIEEELAVARCVVVLWSTSSVASKWVRIEAGEALRQDRLVPALIEPEVRIPLEFSRVQAADLSAWSADQASEAFEHFFTAVSRRPPPGPGPGPGPRPEPPPPPLPPPAPTPLHGVIKGWGLKQWSWVGAAVLLAGGLSQVPTTPSDPQGMEPAPAPAPAPAPGPSVVPGGQGTLTPPVELFDGGIDSPIQWRDHVLNYTGRLFWDGRSALGKLSFTATDQGNGQTVAQGDFQVMQLQVNPQRIRFNMRLTVAGDSDTPTAHAHDINLIFDRQPDNRWRFVQNCPAPNRCY